MSHDRGIILIISVAEVCIADAGDPRHTWSSNNGIKGSKPTPNIHLCSYSVVLCRYATA